MADAPTPGNQAGTNAPSGTSPAAAKKDQDAAAKKAAADKKAADKKAAEDKKSEKAPTEAEAVAQSPVLNGVHVGSDGHPTLLDPFQARDELTKALSDLEQTVRRVETGLSAHYDLTGLRRHLEGARKWFANELGLDVVEGQLVRADGGTQVSTPSDNAGQTGDETPTGRKQLKEAAENRKKAEKEADKA